MSEPRSLASLTAGLLARKGQAQPAGRVAFGVRAANELRAPDTRPAVIAQRQRLVAAFPDAGAADRRIALTLRIDNDRHLQLKLLAARRRTSIQTLLMDALDEVLLEAKNDGCICQVKSE